MTLELAQYHVARLPAKAPLGGRPNLPSSSSFAWIEVRLRARSRSVRDIEIWTRFGAAGALRPPGDSNAGDARSRRRRLRTRTGLGPDRTSSDERFGPRETATPTVARPGPRSKERPAHESGRLTSRPACAGLDRSEEHTSELQSLRHLVCRLLLEKKK